MDWNIIVIKDLDSEEAVRASHKKTFQKTNQP